MQKINTLIAAMIIFGSSALQADCTHENLEKVVALIEECNKKTQLNDHIDCMLSLNGWSSASADLAEKIKSAPDLKAAYLEILFDHEIQHLQDDMNKYDANAADLDQDPELKDERALQPKALEILKAQRQWVVDNLSNETQAQQ